MSLAIKLDYTLGDNSTFCRIKGYCYLTVNTVFCIDRFIYDKYLKYCNLH